MNVGEPGTSDSSGALTIVPDIQAAPVAETAHIPTFSVVQIADLVHLNPTPIVEIDATSGLAYANAAATNLFPEIWDHRYRHPLVAACLQLGRDLNRTPASTARGEFDQRGRTYRAILLRTQSPHRFVAVVVPSATGEGTAEEREQELERLRAQERFKTSFINTAAHELNTPLTPIRLQLHLLKALNEGTLTPEQKESLTILDRNVERLSQLVADVLEVARLQSGRLRVRAESVQLGPLLQESFESFREPARRVGVELERPVDPQLLVHADPRRVTQVLYNLLSNALKFTPAGGTVQIEAQTLPLYGEIRVTDTGIGMTHGQMDRLFQPFSQVHDASALNTPGTGLGLFISKGLAREMGGDLIVESRGTGKGTAFAFRLPRAETAAAPAAAAKPISKEDAVARRLRELI